MLDNMNHKVCDSDHAGHGTTGSRMKVVTNFESSFMNPSND